MPKNSGLVTVSIASGQLEAEIIKGRLESGGIPAVLRYESAGFIFGLTIDGLGQVEVQVPVSFARKAKEILATAKSEDTRLSGQAPNTEP